MFSVAKANSAASPLAHHATPPNSIIHWQRGDEGYVGYLPWGLGLETRIERVHVSGEGRITLLHFSRHSMETAEGHVVK